MRKIKLFCFPYAGGTASAYNVWKPYLDKSIELVPIELAGRGKRAAEPYYQSIKDVVDDVFYSIEAQINNEPYAIFGHSMGSIIGYELYWKIKSTNINSPIHIFFSGNNAPHIKPKIIYHTLDDEEFKKEITQMGGTPKVIFEDKDMYNFFIPVLKSDLKNVDTYECPVKDKKLSCSISVLGGSKDDVVKTFDLMAWKSYSEISCSIYKIDGGHFFIYENPNKVVDIINKTLVSYVLY